MSNPYQIKNYNYDPKQVIEQRKLKGIPENFCPVPFSTIILEPDGKIGSCRLKGSEFPIGHINDGDVLEIWNSEFIQNWRREFLTGEIKICKKEISQRSCHLCSENNKLFPFLELSARQSNPILKLTANFNGYCNLRCQMCNIWAKPNGLYDQLDIWKKLEKNILPHLHEMDLLSGEPFLQRDTYRLIDIMTEVNPSCLWTFTTNAHWKMSRKIVSYLDKIKIKNFIISLDSLNPETYAKIRHPGRLSFVLDNIQRIASYNQERVKSGLADMNIVLNFLVQKDNWQELGRMLEYMREMQFRVSLPFLFHPPELSIINLDENARRSILSYYEETLSWDQLSIGIRAITPLLDTLSPLERVEWLCRLQKKKQKMMS